MTTWFSGDQHLGHKNIIKLCKRPFKNVDEMDATIIRNWNNVVADDDTVYLLGDFTLGGYMDAVRYFSQLKGNIKVLDNPWHHDQRWLTQFSVPISASGIGVMKVQSIVVLELKEYGEKGYPKPLVLCHFPIFEWERKHYGAWHIHAHSHGNVHYPPGFLAVDVGVDNTNFTPVNPEWVAERMMAIKASMSPDLDSNKGVDDG